MAKKHSSPVDSFDWMHKKSNSEIEECVCEWTRFHYDYYSDADKQIRQKTGLNSRSLRITLNEGTVQLIRSLLSTMLVRIDVQSNHQNQHNTNRYTEDRDHHYYSFHSCIITCGPESLNLVLPNTLASFVHSTILHRLPVFYASPFQSAYTDRNRQL